MPTTLLRHHVLGMKNRIIEDAEKKTLGRDVVAVLIMLIVAFAIYGASHTFLEKLQTHPDFDIRLVAQLIKVSLLAFFMLLLFSASISALGSFYSAKDLPLLLTAPVSFRRIYAARLTEVIISSSWMFVLLAVPSLIGIHTALHPHWSFLPAALFLLVPFLVIPAAIGSILITLFVNLVPPHRIRDILVLGALVIVGAILAFHYSQRNLLLSDQKRLDEIVRFLRAAKEAPPSLFPSAWTGDILEYFLREGVRFPSAQLLMLLSAACGLTAAGYLLFDLLFLRGWGMSVHVNKTLRIRRSGWSGVIGRILIPFNQQFRALCIKEARMFLRDTTQSLQLILLLMLTFIYLYNFRALREGFNLRAEGLAWWQAVLALANIGFGACVLAAIAARFVYPSISLEGHAYTLMRATPLTHEQLLRNKFLIWFLPICILGVILFVSGTLAIYATLKTVIVSAVLAIAMSIGIVGLGVGVGAVYAKFDWESPAQVTASFGSLVYMLLSMGLVTVTMLPSIPVFVLTCVPNFALQLDDRKYMLVLACSFFLIFYINYAVSRHALNAGAQRLRELET